MPSPRAVWGGGRLRAWGVAACLAVVLALPARAAGAPWAPVQTRQRVFQAVVDLFRDRYWDPGWMNWQGWASSYRVRVLDASTRAAFDRAMRDMVAAVNDGHSSWLGLAAYAGPAAPQVKPTIGVQTAYLEGEGLVVERVLPGTPAAAAGLRRGDVITEVGGQVLSGRERWDASLVLARAAGLGRVALTVRRQGRALRFALQPVPLDQALIAQEPVGRMLDATTGYIYLPSLNLKDTGRQFQAELRGLVAQGATALVLDMRGNYGGRLEQLGLVLGAFVHGEWTEAVSRGAVAWTGRYRLVDGQGVSTLATAGGEVLSEDRVAEPESFTGPLVVLVDRDNSSAGEVGPLALQDLGRAKVVGTRTRGNVEAIQGFTLPDGSTVMVAVANLEGADGRAFDGGVVPDVEATATLRGLAHGYDAPLAAAEALLHGLPFRPGKLF